MDVPTAAPAPDPDAPDETVLLELLRRGGADPGPVWLALALAGAALPAQDDVDRIQRVLRLDGPEAALADRLLTAADRRPLDVADRLLTGVVVVDVHDTAAADGETSRRVVREVLPRWAARHDLRPVAWTADFTQLRDLTGDERADLGLPPPARPPRTGLVPWQARWLVPEPVHQQDRARRVVAMATTGAVRVGAIAYDLIPVTAAETVHPRAGAGFASHLGVLKVSRALVAVSAAAAVEHEGFGQMLAGQDLPAPPVLEVPLPAQVRGVPGALHRTGPGPLVLCVGRHEPRTNHLAVLHAAECLWREGLEFQVVLVGTDGWHAEAVRELATGLATAGRPLAVLSDVPESQLWATYAAARVLVHPALHEGFALPVADALACGTPVITSDVGSMRELAAGGGAVTVDPHDDRALTDALRAVLTDDALHERLVAEAAARPVRTWDDYARESWQALVPDPA